MMNFNDLFRFTKKEAANAFSHAKPYHSCYGIKVLQVPSQDTFCPRILVVAPKKVGSAPQRNTMKRRTKEVLFSFKEKLPHHTFIILLYQKTTYHTLLKKLTTLFLRDEKKNP